MVTHVVIFKWVAGTTPHEIERLGRALDALAGEIAELVSIAHGPDLSLRDGNGDYALVATFADGAGWNAYQKDGRHKAFVRDFVTPLLASRLTVQF